MRSALPPGPGYPATIQSVGFWKRPLAFLEQCRARYGRRFTIRLVGSPPFVMISDPDELKELFTAPADVLHPGEGARVLEPVVGSKSILLLDRGEHLEQRKLMLPAFHGEAMGRLADTMAEVAEREVASWPTTAPTPLHPRLQRLTLEVILRTVFGAEGERLDGLRERLGAMLKFGDRPASLLPPPPEAIARRVPPFSTFLRLQEEADGMLFDLIDERRRDGDGRDDVLATLLAARHEDGSAMAPTELRDELMTLLVAGHETTASALAWTFSRLAHEPAATTRLIDEIDADAGDQFLTATIQESMRRRPVLPNAAPRLVKRPIEVGGWTYPPGACLVANVYLVHHDPDIYPQPYAFRPERFLEQAPGTYTWIPFGGGRRRCLGASFAMLEMGVVLRAVLRARELQPAGPEVELPRRRNITIKPGGGAPAMLGERRRAPAQAVP